MFSIRLHLAMLAGVALSVWLISGCGPSQAQGGPGGPPPVSVAPAVQRALQTPTVVANATTYLEEGFLQHILGIFRGPADAAGQVVGRGAVGAVDLLQRHRVAPLGASDHRIGVGKGHGVHGEHFRCHADKDAGKGRMVAPLGASLRDEGEG